MTYTFNLEEERKTRSAWTMKFFESLEGKSIPYKEFERQYVELKLAQKEKMKLRVAKDGKKRKKRSASNFRFEARKLHKKLIEAGFIKYPSIFS